MAITPQSHIVDLQDERDSSTDLPATFNGCIEMSTEKEHVLEATLESTQPQTLTKRQQENPSDPNKRVKMLLESRFVSIMRLLIWRVSARVLTDRRNGRSVSYVSQSTRVHSRSTEAPTSDAPHATSKEPTPSDQQPKLQIKHPMLSNSETTTKAAERSLSNPAPPSSFLSQLRNSALEDTDDHKPAVTRDPNILALSLFSRSRTFTGVIPRPRAPVSFSRTSSSLESSISTSRAIARAHSLSPSVARRLGRAQSIQRLTLSIRPDVTNLWTDSFRSPETAATSIMDLNSTRHIMGSCKANTSIGNEDTPEREHIDEVTSPAVESCMTAMRTLSPPSLRTSLSASSLVTVTRNRQPSMTMDHPDTAIFCHTDSDINKHSLENSSCGESTKLHSSRTKVSESSTGTSIPARGMILRRHQTMISSPSEFMRSLEFNSNRRTTCFRSSIDRKSIVFSQDNYVPNPSREDCQILPCAHFVPKPDDTTNRITPQTLADILDGKYKDHYDLLYIIDCRFPYEFEGGHIRSAVNINTIDQLEELLLQPAITDKRVLLIFHCEFSCERGPRMARHLRNQDRTANAVHYPALFYPEVYVMQGGYSGFFKERKPYCSPEAYVKMQDEKHSTEFEEHMRVFGREFSRTASKGFLGTDFIEKAPNGSVGSITSLSPLETTLVPASTSTHSNEGNRATVTTLVTDSTSTTTSVAETSTTSSIVTGNANCETIVLKDFASVVSSVKEAVLSGAAPAPLSLASKKPSLALPRSSKMARIGHLPHPRIMTTCSDPIVAKGKDYPRLDSVVETRASNLSKSSILHSNSNPFFSGFRKTKPGFRGVPP